MSLRTKKLSENYSLNGFCGKDATLLANLNKQLK